MEARVDADFLADRRAVLANALVYLYEARHGLFRRWVLHVGPLDSVDGKRSVVLTGPGVFDE